MNRSLEENLNVLRVIGCDDIVARIAALPEQQQPAAATIAVMQEAPIRDAGLPATYAVLAATYEELPTVVDRLLGMAAAQ